MMQMKSEELNKESNKNMKSKLYATIGNYEQPLWFVMVKCIGTGFLSAILCKVLDIENQYGLIFTIIFCCITILTIDTVYFLIKKFILNKKLSYTAKIYNDFIKKDPEYKKYNSKKYNVYMVYAMCKKDGFKFKFPQYGNSSEEILNFWNRDDLEGVKENYEIYDCELIHMKEE